MRVTVLQSSGHPRSTHRRGSSTPAPSRLPTISHTLERYVSTWVIARDLTKPCDDDGYHSCRTLRMWKPFFLLLEGSPGIGSETILSDTGYGDREVLTPETGGLGGMTVLPLALGPWNQASGRLLGLLGIFQAAGLFPSWATLLESHRLPGPALAICLIHLTLFSL